MATRQQTIDVLSTEHLHADLKGRSVRGGVTTLTSQAALFLLGSVSTVVLARLLTPADFGLVAMVTAITGLGQAFADLGLSEATIQRKEISHEQVSALFWINVAIGAGLMLITVGLAPVLAWFYKEPRLRNITFVLSLTFVICGLRVQHDALLKRQMRFLLLAVRDVTSYLIGVPAAIIVAWRGGGYWALVAFPLTVNSIQMTLSWVMAKWIPSLPRRGSGVGSLVAFGGNVALSYVVNTMIRSADCVLIGWYWGAGPLGLYSRAYNLLMLPVRQLSMPVGSVALPAFSRIQNDPERFARYYLRAVNLIVWISAPVFGFLFVAAEPVIVFTLGNQWRGAAPVFRILVIAALGQLLFNVTIWVFVSRGQSKQFLKLSLIISPIIVASFAIGLPFGIKGVAFSGSVVLLAILPWILKYSFRGTELTLWRLARAILYPISLAVTGVLCAEVALHLAAPQLIVTQLLIEAGGCTAGFLLALLIPSVRKEFMSLRDLFGELRLSSQAA